MRAGSSLGDSVELSSLRLASKVAIVTGAAQGNGFGIAKALARAGATVILTDISNKVEDAAKELKTAGHKALAIKMDVTKSEEVNAAVRKVVKEFGTVDILVNNAGIYPDEPFLRDMPEEFWDRMFNINVKGIFHCLKAVLPTMMDKKHGKIVNMSSVTGPMVSVPHSNAYSASKAAISGLTRALALEVGDYGINVNAICPGYIKTPGSQYLADKERKIANSVPLKRFGTIDDVGDLAVFLASDESSYLTGTEIVIDGGNIIQEVKALP
jgi:NAD(P)-dependent dehydrogenase (short-subunit alcohol dehydrogenase family)